MFDEAIPAFFQNYLGPPDYRIEKRLFLNSPLWMLSMFTIYFSFLGIGTNFMRKRLPMDLRKTMMFYNMFQIIYSLFIFKEILFTAIHARYNIKCQVLDPFYTGDGKRMADAFWYFYVSKIIDLFDTVFLVLRKKSAQLSFLHVYHHSTMIFNWYIGVLYLPGGQAFISVLLNSFVHIIMYLYYFLSTFGPVMQKYLWWKKYLTQLQLTQFFLIVSHILFGLYGGCDQPVWLAWFTITYMMTLITLFLNFYIKAYNKIKKRPKKHRSKFTICEIKKNMIINDIMAGGDKKFK